MVTHPRSLNHVGLTVPDIYKAMDWYIEVLGFTHLMGPRVLDSGNRNEKRAAIIMGPRFRKAYQCQLMTANGVGIELFQFVDPVVEPYGQDNMEYWRQGYWHLCYTDPNIEQLAERIAATGGKLRTQVFEMVPGLPYKLVYAEDPFGNVLEICSHSHAEAWSNWPHKGMDWDITLYNRDGTESLMPNPYQAGRKDGI
jgi:catechol 2,3-dioxygenase-like lactoylglutathione lyase family enzyme